ncbi:MAG: CCA tRNA nucleotidyltransferase [Clostridia bacterium]|nr:CCA tRNA nucleotidyltransferase [Clostridia bacterium]
MNSLFPKEIDAVLLRLEQAGFEAYAVGGCIRDRYMQVAPHDYDVTTSALPQEVLAAFADHRTVETGLQHGTVTVLAAGEPIEITTFRQDGGYSDHRHPDAVTFTRSLREDLARRDFTMNAMAMDRKGEWFDPFEGRADIDARLVRCVGEAERRFEEDALRILRGLRFAARLGFAIEEKTAAAMVKKRELLLAIAHERVFSELCGLLRGRYAADILTQYRKVLEVVLPEMRMREVQALPAEAALRFAALFETEADAQSAMNRLKAPNAFKETVLMLVRERDAVTPAERVAVRKRMAALGAENFIKLTTYQNAQSQKKIAEALLADGVCLSVGELAVNGRDLMALGYRGKEIGAKLTFLLEQVVGEQLPNERDILLNEIKKPH